MKMKKIIAILMSLMLLAGCAAAAAETATEGKVAVGTISINGAFTLQCGLPEGYSIHPVMTERDHVIALLEAEDKTQPRMMLSVAFDETYADVVTGCTALLESLDRPVGDGRKGTER